MRKVDGIIFTGTQNSTTNNRPAGAARLRTFLGQHNYDIEVVDFFYEFTTDELCAACDNFIDDTTLFVGVSITFIYETDKINKLFNHIKTKYPKVKTVIGGSEGSVEGLDGTLIDRFIWGYSEQAVLHYLKFLQRKRLDDLKWEPYHGTYAINAESFYKNDDTDLTIKWLESDLIKTNFLPIEISRGCIFKCKFCQFPLLGKKKSDYIRHVDNLTDEIRRNYEMFGVTNYWFNDDTLNDNIIKLEYIAEAIEKSGVKITYSAFLRADLMARFPETISMLADTGLASAVFGIETLHPLAKKIVGKGQDSERQFDAIRQLKKLAPIWTQTGMIVGLPEEPLSSIFQTQKTLLEMNENFEVLNQWFWFSLTLRKKGMTRLSEFEREHEKYGYSEMDIKELKEGYIDLENLIIHFGNEKTMYWKNKYTNFFQANKIAEILNKEVERFRLERGIRYTDQPIGEHNNAWGHIALLPHELIGLGFTPKEIVEGTIDKKLLFEKIKQSKNDIKNYKKLKLGL